MGSLNTSSVTRNKAFLGALTIRIRDAAAALAQGCPGKILDVGCGNGLFFAGLRGVEKASLFGVDWSADLLRETRAALGDNLKSKIRLVRADMHRLPFKKNALDLVFFLNTLLNMPSRDSAVRLLQELMALCRPGGRLVFDIRNEASPFIRLRYWWFRNKEPFPTHPYDLDEICTVLERNGFAVLQVIPIGIPLRRMAFAYVIEGQRNA